MTVEAINEAIRQLPEEERTSLAAWLNEMEYEKIFHPADDLLEEVQREIAEGKSIPMEEGFRHRRDFLAPHSSQVLGSSQYVSGSPRSSAFKLSGVRFGTPVASARLNLTLAIVW